jgi:hypothetical protein
MQPACCGSNLVIGAVIHCIPWKDSFEGLGPAQTVLLLGALLGRCLALAARHLLLCRVEGSSMQVSFCVQPSVSITKVWYETFLWWQKWCWAGPMGPMLVTVLFQKQECTSMGVLGSAHMA